MEFGSMPNLCSGAERIWNIGEIDRLDVTLDVLVDFVILIIPELSIVQLLKMA